MQNSGFFLCICPDSFLLQCHTQRLIDERFAEESIDRHVIWCDEGLGQRFWDLLSLQGLTIKHRVLVLRHLEVLNAETCKKLSEALAQVRSFVWPLLCIECAWDKGQPKIPVYLSKLPLYTFAERKGWSWRLPPLTTRSMPAFVSKEAQQYGIVFPNTVLAAFCDAVPPQGAAIHTELSKLANLDSKGMLDATCLELITKHVNFDVFVFLRALQMKQVHTVWESLLNVQNAGETPLFSIIALLQREARIFWQILADESPWIYPSEKESKQQMARYLGKHGVLRFFNALHTAEYSVKSGFLQTDQALENLIEDIIHIFS